MGVSAFALCCKVTVFATVKVAASTTTTSPPPTAVFNVAVDSPGNGGVMKRVTRMVPSAATETWRAPVLPRARVATVAPEVGSSFNSVLVACKLT